MGHFPGMANFGYVQPEHHYSSNMLHGPESSNVSSPSSSGQGDDTPAYMHTSNSPPMGDPHSQPGTSGVGSQYVKSEIVGSQYIKGELLDTQISGKFVRRRRTVLFFVPSGALQPQAARR